MMITPQLWIAKKRNGAIAHNLSGNPQETSNEPLRSQLEACLRVCKSKRFSELDKLRVINETRKLVLAESNQTIDEHDEISSKIENEAKRQEIIENIQRLMNFFKEFSFSPNFRFVNTFTKTCNEKSTNFAKQYVANYFALTDNAYKSAIVEKMKSQEFNQIVSFFETIHTQKSVNNRFKLYYGTQGTGKTTEGMKEANNNCIVCHSAMLPSDLMEDFAFDEGKATFKPSQLYKAMVDGKTIVLDEINLLPFESLRFLQSILDGKESFVYKGQTIVIADGFKIIGTMNLQVNGMVYALPEPLVDRAEELREFELTAEQLIGAIL